MTIKAWEVTISGDYFLADKDIIDYDGVKGIIPYCSESVIRGNLMYRYAARWIVAAGMKKPYKLRTCYPDYKETTADFSFVGKDIKEMTYEELQDLAVYKDLRSIPLFKLSSLRETRQQAYLQYCSDVLDKRVEYVHMDRIYTPRDEGFNYDKLPPLVVDGENVINSSFIVREDSNIVMERMGNNKPATLADLKRIAQTKGIATKNMNYDQLYSRVYA